MTSAGSTAGGRDRDRFVGLVVLSFSAFVALTTELAPVGLLAKISQDLDRSASSTGILVTIYAVMVMVLSVPLTLLTRRVSGKRVIGIALIGYIVCNALGVLAPGFGVLIVARCVGGVAHAAFFSACIGQAARLATPGRSARAFAVVSVGISAGYVLGSPVMTALGDAGGWRLPFAILVGLSVLDLALVMWLLPVGASTPAPDTGSRPGSRGLIGVIAANGLTYIGQYVLYTYVTVLLLHAGVPRASAAVVLLVFGGAGLVTVWLTAAPLDARPRATSMTILILVAVGMVAVGATSSSVVPVVIAGTLWGAAFGPVAALFQGAAVRSGTVDPEVAGAWINTTSNMGIAVGSLVGGIVLSAADFHLLAYCGAIPVAVAAVVLAGAVPRRHHD